MVILKKVKASTLMETLVATVLIVIVFMLASMILNSLFSNTIKNNKHAVETYITELEYLYQTENLQLPYKDDFGDWNITVEVYKDNSKQRIEFEAINTKLNKTIIKQKFETH